MSKEKKISVTPFLSKKVKPKNDGEEILYPIYLRISYDRINNQIPANLDDTMIATTSKGIISSELIEYVSEPMFERIISRLKLVFLGEKVQYSNEEFDIDKPLSPQIIEESIVDSLFDLINYIKEIIKFEISIYKENFTLSKFGKRLKHYRKPVVDHLHYFYYRNLDSVVKKKLNRFEINRFENYKFKKREQFFRQFIFIYENHSKIIDDSIWLDLRTFIDLLNLKPANSNFKYLSDWIFKRDQAQKQFPKFPSKKQFKPNFYPCPKEIEEEIWTKLNKISRKKSINNLLQFIDNQM